MRGSEAPCQTAFSIYAARELNQPGYLNVIYFLFNYRKLYLMHHFIVTGITASFVLAGTLSIPVIAGAETGTPDVSLEPSSSVYMALRGNAIFRDDTTNGGNAPVGLRGPIRFDDGFGVAGAIGADLSHFIAPSLEGLRAEFELAYYENDLGGTASNVEANATAYMANLVYDLQPMSWASALKPYIGVGVGAATFEFDGTSLLDDTSTKFAYQLRVGLGYEIRPALILDLGYRYFDASDPEFRSANGKFDTDYRSHAVEAGVRYRF